MTDAEQTAQRAARHTVRSVSLGTVWRLLRYPFVFLSAFLIPRLMGETVYGRYAYFMSVYLSLDILTDVGVTQVFGRFIPEVQARGAEAVRRFLHAMVLYGLAVTLVVIAFVAGPIYLFGRLGFAPLWWTVLCALLITTKLEGTLFAFLYGRNQIARYSVKELLRSAATFVLVLVLYSLFGLSGALWGLLLNEVLLLGVALLWTRADVGGRIRLPSLRAFLPYVVFGLRFFVPMFLFSLLQRAGPVLIKQLGGSYEGAGHFDVANQFLLLTTTFLGLIVLTLLPHLASLHEQGDAARVQRWHHVVLTFCAAMTFLAFAALATVGPHVTRLWLGPGFGDAVYRNALVLCMALAPVMLVYAGMNLAVLHKEPGAYTWGVLGGMTALVLLAWRLIPALGAVGCAWASVAGYTVPAVVFVVRYPGDYRRILGGFVGALLAGALVAPLFLLRTGLAGACGVLALASLLYLGLLLLFRIVKPADARRLWSALRAP